MGNLRIKDALSKLERDALDEEYLKNFDQSIAATNDDLEAGNNGHPIYDLDKTQSDALISHTRQDTAIVHLNTISMIKRIKELERMQWWAINGVWVLIILQIAQLAGCHF